jgi:hypothetical protein
MTTKPMRRILAPLFFMVATSSLLAGHLLVPAYTFNSVTVTNRRVALKLQQPGSVVAGPWLVAGDYVVQYTGTNGQTIFSNVLAGDYSITIYGSPERSFPFSMPDTNGLVNVANLINNTNATPAFYTSSQVDALIAAVSSTNGGAGVTNNQVLTGSPTITNLSNVSGTAAIDITGNAATATVSGSVSSGSAGGSNAVHFYNLNGEDPEAGLFVFHSADPDNPVGLALRQGESGAEYVRIWDGNVSALTFNGSGAGISNVNAATATLATNTPTTVYITGLSGEISSAVQAVIDSYTNAERIATTVFKLPPGEFLITNSIKLRREGQILSGSDNEYRTRLRVTNDINAIEFVPGPYNLGGSSAMNFCGVRYLTITGSHRTNSTKSGVYVGDTVNPTNHLAHYNLINLEDLDITGFKYGVSSTNSYMLSCIRVEGQDCTVGFMMDKADEFLLENCKAGHTYDSDAADRNTVGVWLTGSCIAPKISGGQYARLWKGLRHDAVGTGELTVIGGEYVQVHGTNIFQINTNCYATFISPTTGVGTNYTYAYDIDGQNPNRVNIVGGYYNSPIPINYRGTVMRMPNYTGPSLLATNSGIYTQSYRFPALHFTDMTASDTKFYGASHFFGIAGNSYWGWRLANTSANRDWCFDRAWGSGNPAKDEMMRIGFETGFVWAKGGFVGSGNSLTNVRPYFGTNSDTVTENISVYLTNQDGKIYRMSAQLIN